MILAVISAVSLVGYVGLPLLDLALARLGPAIVDWTWVGRSSFECFGRGFVVLVGAGLLVGGVAVIGQMLINVGERVLGLVGEWKNRAPVDSR